MDAPLSLSSSSPPLSLSLYIPLLGLPRRLMGTEAIPSVPESDAHQMKKPPTLPRFWLSLCFFSLVRSCAEREREVREKSTTFAGVDSGFSSLQFFSYMREPGEREKKKKQSRARKRREGVALTLWRGGTKMSERRGQTNTSENAKVRRMREGYRRENIFYVFRI